MRLFDKLDRFDPNRFVRFRSSLHDERVATYLGIGLGVSFFVCFGTGLISHVIQYPPSWYAWPSRPAGFYRISQGLHVASGLFALPLLFAKLWTVFPKLFEWPPVRNVAHMLERASLPPLIGGAFFMLLTGLANIFQWYPFRFFFPSAHYAMAWVTIGALIVHIGAKWSIASRSLRAPLDGSGDDVQGSVFTRRAFLGSMLGIGGIVTAFTIGQSFSPLGRLALLAPRRPGVGPQGLPVNATAVGAGVVDAATSSDYRLVVQAGTAVPLSFTLDELRALPQRSAELPIACVEGWSASAMWTGVPVRDLLRMAGAADGAVAQVESLEENGLYGKSQLNRHHAADPDTLLALQLNGEPLHLDHGYPCRLIGPNRPGVLQTKWVQRLVVL